MFDGVLARGGVCDAVSDRAWLQAMLDAEAALSRARGLPPSDAYRAELYDTAALGEAAAASGNPVVPLVEALRERAGPEVHEGATSQDILDTAAMLVARNARSIIATDVRAAEAAANRLAGEHRDTPIAGRTLMQQALPTTFGAKAAAWGRGLEAAGAALDALRFAAQLGGPVGTFDDAEVVERYARELGLEPAPPWHTERTRIATLASALGITSGAIAKIAGDVVLLAQTEVGEVSEAEPGGSSSMPHKRNPVAAISARACARQAPGLVATLLACMEQEHERAAGAWHAEWAPLRALLTSTGSAASWLRTCLEGLQVHPERMRANYPS
jgi:3-carboxy-cis,cis-muconate cycloisomerase